MNKPLYSHLVLPIFFLIILVVPLFWLVRGDNQNTTSLVEYRAITTFPNITFGQIKATAKSLLNGEPLPAGESFFSQFAQQSFQEQVEKAASDQFPLRLSGLQTARALESAQIKIAYSFLPDPAIPSDIQSGLYIMKDNSILMHKPNSFNQTSCIMIDDLIDNFNQLIKDNPGINFYAYYIERVEYSAIHPLNEYFPDTDMGQSFEYLYTHKPEKLIIGALQFTNLDDYKIYNFRTDHHWNIYGAMQGYEDIYKMITANYPGIGPQVEHNVIRTFPDIDFLGSLARISLHSIQPDPFSVAILVLPDYIEYVNGKETPYGASRDYLEGHYSTYKYENHYVNYYGLGNTAINEYIFQNDSDKNLLIIGNSQKKSIQAMLASHYAHTYSIDLRTYTDFSFSEFTRTHPVDDVLIIGDGNLFFNQANTWFIKE